MSRSFKRFPGDAVVSYRSNKKAKRIANRSFRRINRMRINLELEPTAIRENSNVWEFPSDGLAGYDSQLVLNSMIHSYMSALKSYINGDRSYEWELMGILGILEDCSKPSDITEEHIRDYCVKQWKKKVSK